MQDPLSGLPAMLLQRGGAARGAPPEPAEPATTVADFLGAGRAAALSPPALRFRQNAAPRRARAYSALFDASSPPAAAAASSDGGATSHL